MSPQRPSEVPGRRVAPRTADAGRFRFRGGRPSLDFCSTLLWRHVDPVEQLREPADLSRWLIEAGLCEQTPALEHDLQQALELRESLYTLFRALIAGGPFPARDVATVNAVASHPPPQPQLRRNARVRWAADEPIAAALSALARDGIDLLTGSQAARVRECEASDCAFLFVDSSRHGKRKWCAMNRCGNREHLRSYRARRR